MLKLSKNSSVQEITVSQYNVASINYIKKKYPDKRTKSKPVTFALQYFGNEGTLVRNSGFSKTEATSIVENYKKLYKVSEDYKQSRLLLAGSQGYSTVAFGLRVRTPLLAKSILGNSKTLREAEAEGRSVGNAMFQSYGLLNNRAAVEFMQRVWASKFKYDVFLVSLIHDAIYFIMKDDIEVVEWVNTNLIECMQWQELPEIQHDQVKLGAELDLFHPDWSHAITLPNAASEQQILNLTRKSKSA